METIGVTDTLRLIKSDYRALLAVYEKEHCFRSLVNFVLYPGLAAAALYRVARYFQVHRLQLLARLAHYLNLVLLGADIAPTSEIGSGFVMIHTVGHVVSARLGNNVILTVRVTLGGSGSRRDIGAGPGLAWIGDRVVLGPSCTVLGPLRIGDGAFVCAHSLVTEDVPAGAKVFGVPAKLVGQSARSPFNLYEEGVIARP